MADQKKLQSAVDISAFHFTPLGRIRRTCFYLTFLADYAYRFARVAFGHLRHWDFPIFEKRSGERIVNEYDRGAWLDFLRSKQWERSNSLRNLLISEHDNALRVDLLEGALVSITGHEHWKYRTLKLLRVIDLFCPDLRQNNEQRLIELGCGWGRNLFSLRDAGLQCRMSGYDQSENGILTAKLIDEKFKTHIEFGQYDLLKNDIPACAGQYIFTHLFLEQLTYHMETILRRILSWSPKRVIHLEPVIEAYDGGQIKDLIGKLYIRGRDYSKSLLTTLRKLEKEGLVRIVTVERIGIGSGPIHEMTSVVWEPS